MAEKGRIIGIEDILKGPMFWFVVFAIGYTCTSIGIDLVSLLRGSRSGDTYLARYMLAFMLTTINAIQIWVFRWYKAKKHPSTEDQTRGVGDVSLDRI